MPQNRSARKRKSSSPYLFILLVLILLTAILIVGTRAMNTWKVYETQAAIQPDPTPTVTPISVTPNPFRATDTPVPPTAPPLPSATPSLLGSGSQGDMVKQLQSRLQELGYYTGNIDGDYGPGTKAAVQKFQQLNGLDADGIAGQKTMAVLYSDSALPAPGPVDTLSSAVPLLVNQWNPLPTGFEPADLVKVKDVAGNLMTYERDSIQGVREAAEALTRMIQAAVNEGYKPWKLREAYRTIADQQRIFNNRVTGYMTENSLTRSQAIARTRQSVADPGSSEHHTGLAFDLNVPGEAFGDTAQYLWLKNNCWDYGFIMRYTDDKEEITGITGEEWHVRYVGIQHSKKIQELGFCLEEYVEWLNRQ